MGFIVTATDVKDIQASLRSTQAAMNATVAQCPLLDAGTKQSWAAFSQTITDYVSKTPVNWLPTSSNEVLVTGNLYAEGVSLQQQLAAWQEKISSSCKLTSPIIQPIESTSSQWQSLARWGLIAVTAAAIAYGVAQIAPLISKTLPKKSDE